MEKRDLEALVRKIVLEIVSGGGGDAAFEKDRDPSGLLAVRLAMVTPGPFDTGKPGDRVRLADVLTLEESPRLGCGIMEMTGSTFAWTLRYDEIDYIIDGTLEILVDGRKVVGRQGDLLFIPAQSSISFSAPDFVRFLYVTYPADWASQ